MRSHELTGRAISLQTFHITPKIAEWDAVALTDRVVEVHPELALRAMAPEVDFAPKKSARGAGQRIAALARWVDPAAALGDLPAGARLDDVLDALAVAWSAARWARGRPRCSATSATPATAPCGSCVSGCHRPAGRRGSSRGQARSAAVAGPGFAATQHPAEQAAQQAAEATACPTFDVAPVSCLAM